jgi:hypothetical protein
MYIQESPIDKIQTPTRWNLIGRSMTVPPPVAQQYSPATFVYCAFIPATKVRLFKSVSISIFLLLFFQIS